MFWFILRLYYSAISVPPPARGYFEIYASFTRLPQHRADSNPIWMIKLPGSFKMSLSQSAGSSVKQILLSQEKLLRDWLCGSGLNVPRPSASSNAPSSSDKEHRDDLICQAQSALALSDSSSDDTRQCWFLSQKLPRTPNWN